MADRAFGVGSVLLHQLPDGQSLRGGFVLGQARHISRRTWQAFAEQRLADPVATQNRTGARGAGLFRQRRRLSEYPSPSIFPDAIDTPPLRSTHAGNAVMFR